MLHSSQKSDLFEHQSQPVHCGFGQHQILLHFTDAEEEVVILQAAKAFILSPGLKKVQDSRIISCSIIILAGNTLLLSALLQTTLVMLIQQLVNAEAPLIEDHCEKTVLQHLFSQQPHLGKKLLQSFYLSAEHCLDQSERQKCKVHMLCAVRCTEHQLFSRKKVSPTS